MKHQLPEHISVDYFVDEEGTYITEAILKQLLLSDNLNRTSTEGGEGLKVGRKLILISGPDGFISSFAGPKIWENGEEIQGKLGGMLEKLSTVGWEVWKL